MTQTAPADEIRAAADRLLLVAEAHPDHPPALDPLALYRCEMEDQVAHAVARLLATEAASTAGDEDHAGCTPDTCTTIAALTLARLINQ